MIYFSLFVQNDHFWWTVALVDTALSSGSWSLCCVELQGCIVSCFGRLDSLLCCLTLFWQQTLPAAPAKTVCFKTEKKKKTPEQNSSCSLSQHLHTHNIIISHYWCDGAVYNWCKYMYKNGSCSSSDTLNMALEDTLWQVWCQKCLPLVLTCHLLHFYHVLYVNVNAIQNYGLQQPYSLSVYEKRLCII